jgi:hypothetical protein
MAGSSPAMTSWGIAGTT